MADVLTAVPIEGERTAGSLTAVLPPSAGGFRVVPIVSDGANVLLEARADRLNVYIARPPEFTDATFLLPANPTAGVMVAVKSGPAGACTVDGNGNSIDGFPSAHLPGGLGNHYQARTFLWSADTAEWSIVFAYGGAAGLGP